MGITPGGPTAVSFMSYGLAKRFSRNRDKLGTSVTGRRLSVGHLGIFVSGGVARKQYGEFASNIDLIDVLPPGLYEAVFEEKSADTANPEFATREWVMRCEVRTLDDIRALGGNDIADDRRFATVARMSETSLALYRTFAQPFVRACVSAPFADLVRRLHPARLQYELMSDPNPFTAMLPVLVGWVREHRRPVDQDNPFLAAQEQFSRQMVSALDAFRDSRTASSNNLSRRLRFARGAGLVRNRSLLDRTFPESAEERALS